MYPDGVSWLHQRQRMQHTRPSQRGFCIGYSRWHRMGWRMGRLPGENLRHSGQWRRLRLRPGQRAGLVDGEHRDVHPLPSTYDEVTNNGIATAKAIKTADPTAHVNGPVVDFWWNYF